MSKVAVIFKVYPKEGGLEAALKKIKDTLKPAAVQTDDMAFGIKVIRARFIFDDEQTSSSRIEEGLRSIAEVSEVEVEEESLI